VACSVAVALLSSERCADADATPDAPLQPSTRSQGGSSLASSSASCCDSDLGPSRGHERVDWIF
jgi:hypothetical protein